MNSTTSAFCGTMAPMDEPRISPTQELILDVLAARHRTGETLWTFGSRTQRAANELEKLGLVSLMRGQVERTYRASLTAAGQQMCMSDTYSSPCDRASEKAYDEGFQHGIGYASGRDEFKHNPYRSAS